MIHSGKLNKRIEIQEGITGSPAVNEFGEPNVIFETKYTVWAAVEPLSGREFFAQQQVQSEINVRFRIRYKEGIYAGMRIYYNETYYMIRTVIDVREAHKELEILTSEGIRDND